MALRQATWLAILAALLFLPAGRWNWPEAWAVLVAYGAFLVLSGVWWLWKDPAQLRERDRVAANVKTWDKVIVRTYWPCRVLTVVIAGFDAGRFRWSSVPLPVETLGWFGRQEDRMLRAELGGYEAYAHRVRYRLLPGVW